jgi:hypothetical protein
MRRAFLYVIPGMRVPWHKVAKRQSQLVTLPLCNLQLCNLFSRKDVYDD